MTLCEDGHPEIVHNEGWRECPLCASNNRIASLEDEIKEKENEITHLENEITKLESEK